MSDRFFWPAAEHPIPTSIQIDGDQAHHAIQVMRYRVGDPIVLFDGMGFEYQAEVESIQKKSLNARITLRQQVPPMVDRQISIAVSFPKGDRQRFMIEKLVELGVCQVIPLKTKRSVVEIKANGILRAEKWVIEACKQCRRADLMRIHTEINLDQLVQLDWRASQTDKQAAEATDSLQTTTQTSATLPPIKMPPIKILAHPYGDSSVSIADQPLAANQPVLIAIGPEGGFDEEEVYRLREGGFKTTTFGRGILRTETAAIAAAAWISLIEVKN